MLNGFKDQIYSSAIYPFKLQVLNQYIVMDKTPRIPNDLIFLGSYSADGKRGMKFNLIFSVLIPSCE